MGDHFPNYAGRSDVDDACAAELEAAGITAERFESLRGQGEVKTSVFGTLHGWGFRRAWRYWTAEGPGIELAAADALHAQHGQTVRVAGHCGCPSPREWFKGLAVGSYHVDSASGLKALADTIRRLVEGPVASPAIDAEMRGFVVANAHDDERQRFRAWGQVGPEWTADRNGALHFARRIDAERFCAEDEDAWRILPSTVLLSTGSAAGISAAARDVLAERRRQIEAEGWTPEHDDAQHDTGDLAGACAAYALHAADRLNPHSQGDGGDEPPQFWPFASAWWKPGDPRRDLVKAVALGLAEIERLDRAAGALPVPEL